MVFVTEDHEEQLTSDCWTKHDRNGLTAQRLEETQRLNETPYSWPFSYFVYEHTC